MAFAAVAPPAGDEPVDDRIEHAARAPEAPSVAQRQTLAQRAERREHRRKLVHHQAERLRDGLRRFALVAPEERLGGDPQRELGHRPMRVERAIALEPLGEIQSIAFHDLSVLRDALAMERGLNDSAHLPVQRILAREQPLAEQEAQHARAERFRKRVLLRYQDVFDQRGFVDEDVRAPRERERHDVAVTPRRFTQEVREAFERHRKQPAQRLPAARSADLTRHRPRGRRRRFHSGRPAYTCRARPPLRPPGERVLDTSRSGSRPHRRDTRPRALGRSSRADVARRSPRTTRRASKATRPSARSRWRAERRRDRRNTSAGNATGAPGRTR